MILILLLMREHLIKKKKEKNLSEHTINLISQIDFKTYSDH